jgi:ribonucleoside-diphosphate reductase beta chain
MSDTLSAGAPSLPGLEPRQSILDPGFSLTLRPMRYPGFYEMYRDAIANTWTVEEVDFSTDLVDLRDRLTPEQHHLVKRLVAFFATGDSIVGNNLVLNLYRHINSPEARMYLGRQLYEEMLHVQFYLTLLDNYIPDPRERQAAFAAIENIPSIKRKADFCFTWMGSMGETTELRTIHDRRRFLLHLICFAACVEGIFFFAAFSYVYFLRDRGLLKGLADGTNWVFRDESMHMDFGFEVVHTVREEEPELWTDEMQASVKTMVAEAIECELAFARDLTGNGLPGLSLGDIGRYLEFVADQRFAALGIPKQYGTPNPFAFMELQDVQSLSNFFERNNASYQIGVTGQIDLDADF